MSDQKMAVERRKRDRREVKERKKAARKLAVVYVARKESYVRLAPSLLVPVSQDGDAR